MAIMDVAFIIIKKSIDLFQRHFARKLIRPIHMPFRAPRCVDLPPANSICMTLRNAPERIENGTEASFIKGAYDFMAIAVLTTLCAMTVLTIAIAILCKKRVVCKRPIAQDVVEMKTCSKIFWDSEIVAKIGDLGVCPSRLAVEKEIGEGW